MTSGDPNIDFSEKNGRNTFVMISDQLSKGFFGFSLIRLGAELEGGGGSQPSPPPIRWWKIQRPIRARVNITSQWQDPKVWIFCYKTYYEKISSHAETPCAQVSFRSIRPFKEYRRKTG